MLCVNVVGNGMDTLPPLAEPTLMPGCDAVLPWLLSLLMKLRNCVDTRSAQVRARARFVYGVTARTVKWCLLRDDVVYDLLRILLFGATATARHGRDAWRCQR